MFKLRNSKPGMMSPRSRGSSSSSSPQKSFMSKLLIFVMTLALFTFAVRLVSPARPAPVKAPPAPVKAPPAPVKAEEEINHYDHAAPAVQHLDHPQPATPAVSASVAELLRRLQATTVRASGGNRTVFTAERRAAWRASHPCRSRAEIRDLYSMRKETKDVVENSEWTRVYEAYEDLHRTCVMQMGNVTEFFLGRKKIAGCKFVVAGVEPGAGLGNKVLSVVAAMVYAVVTQRVLLVPAATAVPGVFCEPFEGSSWEIDPDGVWSEGKRRGDLWISMEEMYRRVDSRHSRSNGTGPAMVSSIYASATTERWDFQPQPRFFCDTEQAQYTRVDWIGFRNNLYYVPKLFAVPSFRPLMESLFPNRNVLTHVLRTLMLPCDSVWGRVKQVHDAHFRHADRRVGVQLRYFHGRADFDATHEDNEEHVKRCLVQNRFLPDPDGSPPPRAISPLLPMNVTTVLVTSLYQGLFDRLTKDFVRTSLESGDAVGVLQLTHEGAQFFGVEVDRQALVEILSLSLTDHLILTPLSTFGALAQGYGSLTPWYIDRRTDTSTPCVRALSLEPCYQIPASTRFLCPHDIDVNGKFMADEVGYISDCHSVEDPFVKVNSAGLGIQLLVDSGGNEEDLD